MAKRRTAEADVKLNDRGKAIEETDFGENVMIVPPEEQSIPINVAQQTESEAV